MSEFLSIENLKVHYPIRSGFLIVLPITFMP